MKKFLVGLLTAACAAAAAFGFSACDKDVVNGKDGINGKDGVSVVNTEVNTDGELIITLSDGTVKNLGVIKGTDGIDGKDGVGIKELKFDADGNMTVIFTDDSTQNLGKIPYCKHSFSEWETQSEATCTSIGYATRECDICGYVDYKFTQATGHIWDDGVYFSGQILSSCTMCHVSRLEATVADLPFILPIENAKISGVFVTTYDIGSGKWVEHNGIDFKGVEGTAVRTVLSGKITEIVTDELGESYVSVEHSPEMTTVYKYIVADKNLKVGDTVMQGDIIGAVDYAIGAEKESGEHLHFAVVIDGKAVNPIGYFNADDLQYSDNVELPGQDIEDVKFTVPVDGALIKKSFGAYYDKTLDRYVPHTGFDFKIDEGASVKAAFDGTVMQVVTNNIFKENYVEIVHFNGLATKYLYIAADSNLKVGDKVKQGDVIGTVGPVGTSESSDGVHLHFGVSIYGKSVDPKDYFNAEDLRYPGYLGIKFILPAENCTVKGYNRVPNNRHLGFDFNGEEGTGVKAALDGTVTEIVMDNANGENYVTVEHMDGMSTIYKYITATEGLKVGDKIKQGDAIGVIAPAQGAEAKDGAHLHFEVMIDGWREDPRTYFNADDLN